MAKKQETLIYIEQDDILEASRLSRGFAVKDTQNRAYVNALGSELAMKYLALENINVSNIYNLHSIQKILEEFDIADVMLPNIHIDVRMVYDENLIFVPKSHFKYGLTPDIYLVFQMNQETSHVKFLGFFEPKLINKNNQNDEYYFIEKEKLSHPADLKSYINDFNGNTTQALSKDELEDAQRLAISLIDQDITDSDKQKLINMLIKSAALREDLTEFGNFEVLSYNALKNSDLEIPDFAETADIYNDEFEMFEDSEPKELEAESPAVLEALEETAPDTDEISDELKIEETAPSVEDVLSGDLAAGENELDIDLENIVDEIPRAADEEPSAADITSEKIDELSENPVEDSLLETLSIDESTVPLEDLTVKDAVTAAPAEEFHDLDLETVALDEEQMFEVAENHDIQPDSTDDNLTDETFFFDDLEKSDESYETSVDEQQSETVSLEEFGEETTPDDASFPEPLADESREPGAVSFENSTIIGNSGENFTPGEILIDINRYTEAPEEETDMEQLEVLYKENADIPQNENLTDKTSTPEKGKKAMILAMGLTAAVIGILAISLVYYLSLNKSGNQIANNDVLNALENNLPELDEQKLPEEDSAVILPKKSELDDAADIQSTNSKTPVVESPYIDVKKLTWSVPDYVSYNENFKNYLQTAGKSLKLSLSSDLLLATEYAYSDQIQVDVTLTKEGAIQDAKIIQSSGSTEIDNIVLRTVKDTLNVLKAPAGVIVGNNIHLMLKISI